MSTVRTIACLIITAACVASFGTNEAAAKPRGVAAKGRSVQEELKLKSRATHGKFNNAKMMAVEAARDAASGRATGRRN